MAGSEAHVNGVVRSCRSLRPGGLRWDEKGAEGVEWHVSASGCFAHSAVINCSRALL